MRLPLRWFCFGSLAFTMAFTMACTDPESDPPEADDGTTSSSGNTTIPVTTIGGDGGPVTTMTDSTAGDPSTGAATDSTGTSTGAADSTSGGESGSSSEGDASTSSDASTGGNALVVEWCILQFPAEITTAVDTPTTVYARVYVEGITDQTQFVDEDPLVVAEFGIGEDDSLPDDSWTWVAGEPNPGWDGTMAKGGFGNENNDEYQADLSFAEAGTWDYAARMSADGGETWVYCDLDGLVRGGYTVDQAGNAVITP